MCPVPLLQVDVHEVLVQAFAPIGVVHVVVVLLPEFFDLAGHTLVVGIFDQSKAALHNHVPAVVNLYINRCVLIGVKKHPRKVALGHGLFVLTVYPVLGRGGLAFDLFLVIDTVLALHLVQEHA